MKREISCLWKHNWTAFWGRNDTTNTRSQTLPLLCLHFQGKAPLWSVSHTVTWMWHVASHTDPDAACGSKNFSCFPAKISTSNHCPPDGVTCFRLMTVTSSCNLQNTVDTCSPVPHGMSGQRKRWWNSLLSTSPLCCGERTLQLHFLCRGQAGEESRQVHRCPLPEQEWPGHRPWALHVLLSCFQKPVAFSG